eukprot:s9042_g1.t1
MRDEDLRVKIALSAQRCADLRQAIKECNPEALLEAELAAPAEAKRALASLRIELSFRRQPRDSGFRVYRI